MSTPSRPSVQPFRKALSKSPCACSDFSSASASSLLRPDGGERQLGAGGPTAGPTPAARPAAAPARAPRTGPVHENARRSTSVLTVAHSRDRVVGRGELAQARGLGAQRARLGLERRDLALDVARAAGQQLPGDHRVARGRQRRSASVPRPSSSVGRRSLRNGCRARLSGALTPPSAARRPRRRPPPGPRSPSSPSPSAAHGRTRRGDDARAPRRAPRSPRPGRAPPSAALTSSKPRPPSCSRWKRSVCSAWRATASRAVLARQRAQQERPPAAPHLERDVAVVPVHEQRSRLRPPRARRATRARGPAGSTSPGWKPSASSASS